MNMEKIEKKWLRDDNTWVIYNENGARQLCLVVWANKDTGEVRMFVEKIAQEIGFDKIDMLLNETNL